MLQLHNTVTWHCKVEVSLSKTLKLGNAEENRPKPISVNARLGVEDCYLLTFSAIVGLINCYDGGSKY